MQIVSKRTHSPTLVWPTWGIYSRRFVFAFGRGTRPMFAIRVGPLNLSF